MTEWVLHDGFHYTFLGVNLLGVGVSCWAAGVLYADRRALELLNVNGQIAYAAVVNLRQELHRLVVQFGFVLIALLRVQGNEDFSALPHPGVHLASGIIAITGVQSAVLLWASIYGRWARVALRRMVRADAVVGGRRRYDPKPMADLDD